MIPRLHLLEIYSIHLKLTDPKLLNGIVYILLYIFVRFTQTDTNSYRLHAFLYCHKEYEWRHIPFIFYQT